MNVRQYLANLKAWLGGWTRFDEIAFKPGWTADWRWWLLYLFDYGSHVLVGGACMSWSRWAYEERDHKVAGWIDRWLNALDDNHGAEAGPALWGTRSAWHGD